MANINVTCPRCGYVKENDRHIFFECRFTGEIWKRTALTFDIVHAQASGMKDLMGLILNSKPEREVQVILMTLWMIWNARNKLVFEGLCMRSEVILEWIRNYLMEINQTNRLADKLSKQELNRVWRPPEEDLMKVNVDAACKEDKTGIGMIIRNADGQTIAAKAERLGKSWSVEMAELLAISHGLQWAKEVGLDAFVLESDSINVVRRLCSREQDLSMIGHLVDKVRKVTEDFLQCKIVHVCRTGNIPAHLLAKIGWHLEHQCVWWDNFPSEVVNAALRDLHE